MQVFQRRENGHVDFYRTWNDYKKGFGDLNAEFWLGKSPIFNLTILLPDIFCRLCEWRLAVYSLGKIHLDFNSSIFSVLCALFGAYTSPNH